MAPAAPVAEAVPAEAPAGVEAMPAPRPPMPASQVPTAPALLVRLFTEDFMGFPAQVWLGAGAMAVIMLLLFVVG